MSIRSISVSRSSLVIASTFASLSVNFAKQSLTTRASGVDCFLAALLAMTPQCNPLESIVFCGGIYYSNDMMSTRAYQGTTDSVLREGESLDALGSGGLRIIQSVNGFRHSMDALLLASFASPRPSDRVLDLGCGNGAIGLLLAHRHPRVRIVGLEIQPALASRARRGAQINGLHHRVEIVEGDLRRIGWLLPLAGFDLVLCNPPYRELGRGRLSPDPETRQAKHEMSATLQEVIAAVRYALAPKGRACLIYHGSRLADLLTRLRAERLEPKLLRPVHSFPGADAELILVEARREGRPGLRMLAPLFVYQMRGGALSPAMEEIYREPAPTLMRSGIA
jgi:tRNA1Val (adenine37-N6)-methyltransferase